MKTTNAIKKLEKAGFRIEQEGRKISGWKGEYRVSFYDQDGSITCIHTDCDYSRKTRDPMSDYYPETFHDNVTQAINFVGRQLERKETERLQQLARTQYDTREEVA